MLEITKIKTFMLRLIGALSLLFLLPFSVAYAATTTGNATNGGTDFSTYGCTLCHTSLTTVDASIANAANAGNVVSFINGTPHFMGTAFPLATATTISNDIAAYIATGVAAPTLAITPAYNTAVTGIATSIYTPANAVTYNDVIDTLSTVTAPARGTLSYTAGAPSTITYTPSTGACGTDTFTYEGKSSNAGSAIGTSSQRTVTVTFNNATVTVPSVTAGQTATGTYNVATTAGAPLITVAQTSGQSASLCGATNFSATGVGYSATAVGYATTGGAYPPGVALNTTTGALYGTPTAAGTYTVPVFAINPGGPSAQGSITITINNATPSITTPTISPATLAAGGSSTLSATSPSPATITYATSTPAVCSLSGTNNATVTGITVGTCSITASQLATTNYNGATSGQLNITVGTGAQTIVFATAPASVVVNPTVSTGAVSASTKSTANLTLATTPQSALLYSAAAGTGSCTVNSSTGAVTGTAAGTCAITATQSGTNPNYATATPVAQTVTVGKGAQTISFNSPLPAITVGGTATAAVTSFVTGTTTPTGLSIAYSTTSTACSVNPTTGAVLGITSGNNNCIIKADQAGSINYNAAVQVSQTFSVGLAAQSISFGAAPATVVYSPTNQSTGSVSATASPSGLPVTYSVVAGGTGNCTVNPSTGAVVGTAGGTCIIAANQAGDGVTYGAAAQVTQSITVGTIGQSITFAAPPTSVVVNSAASTGSVSATSNSGLAVSYSAAAGTGSCSVNATTGAVTGLATGTCIITATQAGSANYNAATAATLPITVGQGSQTISSPPVSSLTVGGAPGTVTATSYIGATATATGLSITFNSTTPTVCTVSGTTMVGQASTATVNIVGAGNCVIAANQAGNADYASAQLLQPVTITINKGSQTVTASSVPTVNVGTTGTLLGHASTGFVVSYSSGTPAICTVNATTGLVAGITAGSCSIVMSQAGDANYSATQTTQIILIGKGNQTITATKPNISSGMTVTLEASASSGLPLTLTSTTPAVCTVSGLTVSGISVGDCSLTLTQAGDTNYNAATPFTLGFRVKYPPPRVSPVSMSVQLNSSRTIDLNLDGYIAGKNGATGAGNGVTGVGIAVQPAHGTATAAGTKVTYVPKPDYFGTDTFDYVAYGADDQVSASGKVTVTISGRPDPLKDARVTELIKAEAAAIKRFGMSQVFNFQQRLESRHRAVYSPTSAGSTDSNTGAPATSGGAPAPAGGAAPSGQGRGYFNSWQPGTVLAYANEPNNLLRSSQLADNGQTFATDQMYGVLMNAMAGVLTTSTLNLGTVSNVANSMQPNDEFGRVELWVAGNVRFGTRTQSGMDSKFTTDGISVGADRRMDRKLTLGMGMGYARDRTNIGSDGTSSSATGNSVAGYASYMMDSGNFLDVLLGYGRVNFDTNRYVPAANDFAKATRTGDQLFGSFSFGYEYRKEGLLWSPYGRYDFSYDRLNTGTESGAGINALSYSSQNLHSSHVALGMRAQSVHQTDFGVVQPHARFEYQRGFEATGQTSVAYADLLDTQYSVAGTSQNSNAYVVGLGNTFVLNDTLRMTFDYQRLRAAGGLESYQSVNLRVTKTIKGKNDFASLLEEGYETSIAKPTGLSVIAGYSFDDNVSRASDSIDRLSDTSFSLMVNKALSMLPTKNTRLTASGFMDVEKFRNYAGLGHLSVGAQGEFAYRFSGDFGSPTFGIFARYTADAYDSELRDGSRRVVGVNLRKSLTDRINLFMAVSDNVRTGKSDVFNLHDKSGRLNLDYALAPGQTLYLTGEFRKGDIVSSGQPSLKILDSSIVFVRDDVFTSPWFYDYRMQGKTSLLTLGYNYSLGTKDSVDFSWRHVRSTPDNIPAYATSMQYIDNLFTVSYLMAF